MDDRAAQYIQDIDAQRRPLFDRLHALILSTYPGVDVGYSYRMPTYRVGGRSLIVGVWKHGLSFYGLESDQIASVASVLDRHALRTSGGTIWIRPADAAAMNDSDLAALVDVALGATASP